jgi:phosphomannomutase
MTKEEQSKDLEKLTRTKLVEEAKKYPDIEGAHGLTKEQLLEAISAEKKKLGEDVEKAAPAKPAASGKKPAKLPDKAKLKAALKDLKKKRLEAVKAKDGVQLKRIRTRYKKVNRVLRRVSSTAG